MIHHIWKTITASSCHQNFLSIWNHILFNDNIWVFFLKCFNYFGIAFCCFTFYLHKFNFYLT